MEGADAGINGTGCCLIASDNRGNAKNNAHGNASHRAITRSGHRVIWRPNQLKICQRGSNSLVTRSPSDTKTIPLRRMPLIGGFGWRYR
jgi:hypothetical protein